MMPNDYAGQACSLARALEVVGERWTLLIVRDAFFGVRRFGDFADHLQVPRAVLARRLAALDRAGVLDKVHGSHGHQEYALTPKGVSLWPVVRGMLTWGDDHYSSHGPLRVFLHATDGGEVAPDGACAACGGIIAAADLLVAPGPGFLPPVSGGAITAALDQPHRMLDPIKGKTQAGVRR